MADIYALMHDRLPDNLRLRWVDKGNYWAQAAEVVGALLSAGEAHIGAVGGSTNIISTTIRRPNDANIYAIDDVLSSSTTAPDLMTFGSAARIEGGAGWVIAAIMITDQAQATRPDVRLILFDAAPIAQNDNAAFTPTGTDAAHIVGWIDFDAYQNGIVNTIYYVKNFEVAFHCAPGQRALYGIPVMKNAYAPVANENFTFKLEVMQD